MDLNSVNLWQELRIAIIAIAVIVTIVGAVITVFAGGIDVWKEFAERSIATIAISAMIFGLTKTFEEDD